MLDLTDTMIQRAKQILEHAYAPYSNYRVASCLCSEDGTLYTGVNVENASYGLTVCAETSAICKMVTAGKNKISSLVVMNSEDNLCSPCGACRQRIMEFSTPTTIIHLCTQHSVIKSLKINELLPFAFSLKL